MIIIEAIHLPIHFFNNQKRYIFFNNQKRYIFFNNQKRYIFFFNNQKKLQRFVRPTSIIKKHRLLNQKRYICGKSRGSADHVISLDRNYIINFDDPKKISQAVYSEH